MQKNDTKTQPSRTHYWSLRLAHKLTRGRRISAMIRVRNEEEFLRPSVESIVDLVNEIVIVDNLSSDGTPAIIEELRRKHSTKVVVDRYPYEVRRVGQETLELVNTPGGVKSPHHSATFYNFCLRRCRYEFVLKWDGDMIATEEFAVALESWRKSGRPILVLNGANVHPNRSTLVAARSSDRDELLARLNVPTLPMWVTTLTYDAPEPRLFPRFRARYSEGKGWTQALASPYCDFHFAKEFWLKFVGVSFLHMKFCKSDPYSNYSPDLAEVIRSNITVGPPLSPEHRDLLARQGLVEVAS
jgi:glycosyltransferase involved in cell wall biosynthesis